MFRILKYILTELTWCFRKTELPPFLFSQIEALTPAAQNGDEPKHLPKLHCLTFFPIVVGCINIYCFCSHSRCWFVIVTIWKVKSRMCFHAGWSSKNGDFPWFSVVFSPFQKNKVWLCMACFQVTLPASDTMKPWPPQWQTTLVLPWIFTMNSSKYTRITNGFLLICLQFRYMLQ